MKLDGLAARVERLEQRHSTDPPQLVGFVRPGETEAQARARILASNCLTERSRTTIVFLDWADRDA